MIYIQLFLSFLQIGAFSFGGGYAALPLIQDQIVTNHQWLSIQEFTDLITLSQMTPGPIAINAATFVGTKIAGISGAFVATVGCVLPSCLLVTLLAYFYLKYRNLKQLQAVLQCLRPAVVALIAGAGLSILQNTFSLPNRLSLMIIFSICFYILHFKKVNPITVMILAGFLNAITYLV